MEFDFRKLTGRIVAEYGSRQAFAKAMGITKGSLSNKLNNKAGFSGADIRCCCELLSIKPEEIGAYFFTPKVHNCEQLRAEKAVEVSH